MKRTLSLLLAGMLMLGLCGASLAENTEEQSNAPYEGLTSLHVITDGQHNLEDGRFKSLFDGKAKKAIPMLIEAGAVTVNGQVIGQGEVSINGGKALWQNANGTWAWKTHILNHGEKIKSYEKAAYEFTVGISRLRGPEMTISITDGKATGIDFLVQDVCMAATVTIGEEYTTMTTCGDTDGSMERANPATIQFPNALVEPDSQGVMPGDYCMVLYWQDQEGWHLKRADSAVVEVPVGFEGYVDTRINLEYSQPWNRPSQAIDSIGRQGADSAEMTQWFLGQKYTCGFSRLDPRRDLLSAIETAENALEEVKASQDGTDLPVGTLWVTPEEYGIFEQFVSSTKAAAGNDGLLPSEYEQALYAMALSYGGSGKNHIGNGNVFENGVGFMTLAQRNAQSED